MCKRFCCLSCLLVLVLKFIVKKPLENPGYILYGIGAAIVGMCIFNVGLTYGLSKLGADAGSLVPSAFMEVHGVANSPDPHKFVVGLILVLVFAWFLGFGATLAEPALNALGVTTEKLTNGVFKKKTLVHAVSVGVAFGIATGVAKLVFHLPLIWLIASRPAGAGRRADALVDRGVRECRMAQRPACYDGSDHRAARPGHGAGIVRGDACRRGIWYFSSRTSIGPILSFS